MNSESSTGSDAAPGTASHAAPSAAPGTASTTPSTTASTTPSTSASTVGPPSGARGRVVMAVRWSDVDLFGHVNNAAFLRYLDDARFTLFPQMGVDASGALTASLLVVAKHEIDYLAPLTFRPVPFVVEVWVPRTGRSSVDMAYEIRDAEDDGTVCLRARSRMVQLDAASHQPRPFTPQERDAFAAYAGPEPALHGW